MPQRNQINQSDLRVRLDELYYHAPRWTLQQRRICKEHRNVGIYLGLYSNIGDKTIKIGEGTFANVYKGKSKGVAPRLTI